VPVRWWHGAADHVVPIAGVHTTVSCLQDAALIFGTYIAINIRDRSEITLLA
jgi:hypothetical protein